MGKQATKKRTGSDDVEADMPLWASKLIERFDLYSSSLQSVLTSSFDRFFALIGDIQSTQNSILARLSELEAKFSSLNSRPSVQKSLLYSTMVKLNADRQKIDDKQRMITWVGIDEQSNEEATRRFDREILKEEVLTSGNEELIREFEAGHISAHRHPPGKPRNNGGRGRIIKISLPNQSLRDSLLAHMRCGRKSLTQRFVHSFARRDYTTEELELDRALRKEAGDLNAREGRLAYVVRDFDIVKLRSPRELPRRRVASNVSAAASAFSPVDGGEASNALNSSRTPVSSYMLSPLPA